MKTLVKLLIIIILVLLPYEKMFAPNIPKAINYNRNYEIPLNYHEIINCSWMNLFDKTHGTQSLFSILYRKDFKNKVETVCSDLKIEPEWLVKVCYNESRLIPAIKNSKSGAYGLIQIMPGTAKSLHINIDSLKSANIVQQLNYVEIFYKYWQKQGLVLNSYEDLYIVTFYPLALTKPDTFILGSEKNLKYAKIVAKQNPGIYKENGFITKRSLIKWIQKF